MSVINISQNWFLLLTSLISRILPKTTETFGCGGSHGLILLDGLIVIVWNSNWHWTLLVCSHTRSWKCSYYSLWVCPNTSKKQKGFSWNLILMSFTNIYFAPYKFGWSKIILFYTQTLVIWFSARILRVIFKIFIGKKFRKIFVEIGKYTFHGS